MNERSDQPYPGVRPETSTEALPWAGAPVPTGGPTESREAFSGNGSAAALLSAADAAPGPAGFGPGPDRDQDDLDLLEPAWAPSPLANRWTVLLAAGLVTALGFGGGVLVQKNHDAGLAGSAGGAGAAARAFARAGGFGGTGGAGGTGGFGGGGAGGSGGTGGRPGNGTQAGAEGGGSGPAAGTPVVVGTVVSVAAGTLVVQNFAGAKVTVTVPAGTPVTSSGLTGLQPGASVSVTGTKAADGTVTATSVTSRRRG